MCNTRRYSPVEDTHQLYALTKEKRNLSIPEAIATRRFIFFMHFIYTYFYTTK